MYEYLKCTLSFWNLTKNVMDIGYVIMIFGCSFEGILSKTVLIFNKVWPELYGRFLLTIQTFILRSFFKSHSRNKFTHTQQWIFGNIRTPENYNCSNDYSSCYHIRQNCGTHFSLKYFVVFIGETIKNVECKMPLQIADGERLIVFFLFFSTLCFLQLN